MAEWTVSEPTVIELDEPVRTLKVRLVDGHVDVVATAGAPGRVEVGDLEHGPLQVSNVDGVLTIRHEKLSWSGVLGWLASDRRRAVVSVAVPADCAASIAVVSAGAVVAGLQQAVHVRTVSGDVTLDEVGGPVEVESVSGDIEGRGLRGEVRLKAVSGALTVVDGGTGRVRASSVSGDVVLDVGAGDGVDVTATTVSGDLLVRLPGDPDVRVDLASSTGELDCAFDELEPARRGGPVGQRLRGTLGSGAGAVHGRTVSGRVALLARENA